MSSDLQSIVVAIQQNNYASLAILIAVGYDYILVLPKEIQYIWNKQWSWVTIMFLLARPLLWSIYAGVRCPCCNIMLYGENWTFILFIGAAEFVMILRVWAMYNQSRLVITFLLAILCIGLVALIVVVAAVNTRQINEYWVATQVLEYSFCTGQLTFPAWSYYIINISQMTFGTVWFMLATAQFVRQSLQMYRITKQWKLSRYMNLLIKQGSLYFLGILLLNITGVLGYTGYIPNTGWQFILFVFMEYVPVFTLTPRFIISIREMYAHDVQGRRGGGIDSGFGLSTLSSSNCGAAGGPMVFAAGVQSEAAENAEADNVDGQNQITQVTGDIELVPREVESAQQV